MIDPVVGAALAAAFSLLFASAAVHKALDRARFAEAFRAYAILPGSLAGLALLVPVLEFAVATGLLVRTTRPGAVLTGIALLVAYAAAIGVNLARGRTDLSCGCGGPNDRTAIAPWMVARNLVLAALLGSTLLPATARELGAVDALTIAGGALVAALLYLSIDVLLGRVRPRTATLGGAA